MFEAVERKKQGNRDVFFSGSLLLSLFSVTWGEIKGNHPSFRGTSKVKVPGKGWGSSFATGLFGSASWRSACFGIV